MAGLALGLYVLTHTLQKQYRARSVLCKRLEEQKSPVEEEAGDIQLVGDIIDPVQSQLTVRELRVEIEELQERVQCLTADLQEADFLNAQIKRRAVLSEMRLMGARAIVNRVRHDSQWLLELAAYSWTALDKRWSRVAAAAKLKDLANASKARQVALSTKMAPSLHTPANVVDVSQTAMVAPIRTLGTFLQAEAAKQFQPPIDWRKEDTVVPSIGVSRFLELYKLQQRTNNSSLPMAERRPEYTLLAETGYWKSKGVVPVSWTLLPLSDKVMEIATSRSRGKRPETGNSLSGTAPAPTLHRGASSTHIAGNCATDTLGHRIGMARTVKPSPKQKVATETRSVAAPTATIIEIPPVMTPPAPPVSLVSIQLDQQAHENNVKEAKAREEELKASGTIVEQVHDKRAKSALAREASRASVTADTPVTFED
jgi:hypothetical protein